jgi:hypothetical protein
MADDMDHLAMANDYSLSAEAASAHALIAIVERLDRLCDLLDRLIGPFETMYVNTLKGPA